MVVPVLMTSCQVSEYPNSGPLTIHTIMVSTARPNAGELPDAMVAVREKRSSQGGRGSAGDRLTFRMGVGCRAGIYRLTQSKRLAMLRDDGDQPRAYNRSKYSRTIRSEENISSPIVMLACIIDSQRSRSA